MRLPLLRIENRVEECEWWWWEGKNLFSVVFIIQEIAGKEKKEYDGGGIFRWKRTDDEWFATMLSYINEY